MEIKHLVGVAGLVLTACSVFAQLDPYPLESELRFQVWNGSEWTQSVQARPGDRVEWRAVVSYRGPNPNVMGLGQINYQPTLSNWDNEGPSQDRLGAWRTDGESVFQRGGILSTSEGEAGGSLASYGRVGFAATGMVSQFQNRITEHRHSAGQAGAPEGSWMRIAGNYVTSWPTLLDGTAASAHHTNSIGRGMTASQHTIDVTTRQLEAYPLSLSPYDTSNTDIVILRQAVILSDQSSSRSIEISSFEASLDRAGVGSTDDRRYMQWHDSPNSNSLGTYRSAVEFIPAHIIVTPYIPAPAGGLAMIAGLCGFGVRARRRRSV